MNIVYVAGHLGADPETRFTSSGQKVTTLRLAARARKSNTDETIWWRVTIWGEQFDKMMPYLKKGSALMVVGEMSKPEIFTDRNGNPQISMGITASNLFFSPFGKSDKMQQGQDFMSKQQSNSSVSEAEKAFDAATVGGSANSASAKENELPAENSEFGDDEVPF